MKKYTLICLSLITVVALSFSISSCGDDDEPATNAKLSFAESTMTVGENDGSIEIEVVLDKAVGEDIVVEYDLKGTAVEGSTGDYEIDGDIGEIEIRKGETVGVIKIDIRSDASFEPDETIEISLEDVSSNSVDITNKDGIEITIEDDDVQSVATFNTTTGTITEGTLVAVEVKLDKALEQDVTITYALSGSARDSVTAVAATPDLPSDYAIRRATAADVATPGELVIAAGQTTGVIRMVVYTDFVFDDSDFSTFAPDPETIIITLTGGSGGISLGTNKVMTISVTQQNGQLAILEWGVEGNQYVYDDVDMDIFFWAKNNNVLVPTLVSAGWTADIIPPELLIMPDGLVDGQYGMSYTYWGGTEDPMDFIATFVRFQDGVFLEATEKVFTASYGLENINEWTNQTTGTDPVLAQTFTKTGTVFSAFSDITVNATGSRVRTGEIPAGARKYSPVQMSNAGATRAFMRRR